MRAAERTKSTALATLRVVALLALKLVLTLPLIGGASLDATLGTHHRRLDHAAVAEPARGSGLVATNALGTGLVGTPYVFHCTLGQLRDRLLRRRDRLGISYYAIPGRAMGAMAPLVAALTGR
jgi:hypothetical protein